MGTGTNLSVEFGLLCPSEHDGLEPDPEAVVCTRGDGLELFRTPWMISSAS